MEHNQTEKDEHGLTALIPLAISALLLTGSFFLRDARFTYPCLIVAFLLPGFSVMKDALADILHGRIMDECFLMTVAALGAIALGEWREGTVVMLFYQLGEFLQDKAVESSRKSVSALSEMRPDTAEVLRDGAYTVVPAESLTVGETVLVRVGDRIPADGTVLSGSSLLDASALTGESLPVGVSIGDEVLAGCINTSAVITLRVDKPFGASTASRILALTEEAAGEKTKTERFITKFSRVYTPVVIMLAVLFALLPPLLHLGAWPDYLYRALNFLVISCPCALIISVPLAYFAGLGAASRNGILVKGSQYFDTLALARTFAFDKTGTLTTGKFAMQQAICAENVTQEELLCLAAHAESASRHPLAAAILSAFSGETDASAVSETVEEAGKGVTCVFRGKRLCVGTEKYVKENGFTVTGSKADTTAVHIGYGGKYCGALLCADPVKSNAAEALSELRKLGITKTVLLSGDRKAAVERLAAPLCLDEYHAELLPQDKLKILKDIKSETETGSLLYVGDGINDAPVLSFADAGIAMGGIGSDAALESADIVLMGDDLCRIPLAVRIGRKTRRIAKENIGFALSVKAAVLLLSAVGTVGLPVSVFSDVGVCLIAVLNSLRALRT